MPMQKQQQTKDLTKKHWNPFELNVYKENKAWDKLEQLFGIVNFFSIYCQLASTP